MGHPTNPWIGQTVCGRYQVLSLLKEGGMASLYLAQDYRTRQQVVIKTPRPELLSGQEFLSRFAREVRALSTLVHPNIVPILDSGEHQGRPFFVLKYMPGGTLRNRQPMDSAGKPQPVALDSLLLWLGPIAEALDYLHSENFIHRDVKPDNILFDTDGTPYLCDFGILKVAAEGAPDGFATQLTSTGHTIGTPQYMAPELIAPDLLKGHKPDGRADQYSLGVTLYELLAGQPPIADTNVAQVLIKIMQKKSRPLESMLPGLPPELTKAVNRAIAVERNQRFPNCREFSRVVMLGARLEAKKPVPDHELVPVLEVVPPADRPSPRPTPAKQPSGPAPVLAKVTCPECGAVYQVPRSDARLTIACTNCREVFDVVFKSKTAPPTPVSQAQIETPPDQTPTPTPPARPVKRTTVKGIPGKTPAANAPATARKTGGFGFPWRFLLKSIALSFVLGGLGVGGWFGYQWLMGYVAENRIKQSARHLGTGNYADALQAADTAVKYNPSPSTYYQRGRVRMMMLDWFGAFDDFNTICEELDKDYAPAYASRAEARMQLGLNNEKAPQRKEALNDVDKAIRLNKTQGYSHAVKGWILAHREEGGPDPSKDVEDAFRKAKEFSPTDPEVLLLRGHAFAWLNKSDEAEQCLGEALHYASKGGGEGGGAEQYDENRYLASRGLINCRNQANLPAATSALAKLPQGDYFYRPLLEGDIAAARGENKRAADQYEAFIRTSPRASSIYVKMADCYMKQGGKPNLDVAETRATEGLQSCPKSAALYAKRGEIRVALAHYDDAVADFDMALKFNSEHPQAKTLRADTLQKADAARSPKKPDSIKDK